MLIVFVRLMDAGLIVGHPATLVTLGNVTSLPVILAVFGLIVTGIFAHKKYQRCRTLWYINNGSRGGFHRDHQIPGGIVSAAANGPDIPADR